MQNPLPEECFKRECKSILHFAFRMLHSPELHLWRIDLAAAAANLDALGQTLSPDERARAGRLIAPLARARFVAGRGALRAALARYVGEEAAALRFRYGPTGKPRLDGPRGDLISFNLAHSHDLALLAVSSRARVGVDVELVGDADHAAIAAGFFAPDERHALAALPLAQRREAFYRCWVCKEAFVKARGDGLSLALDRFAVSVTPGVPAALQRVDGDPDEVGRWQLIELAPAEGFVAALCVERPATGEATPTPRLVLRPSSCASYEERV